MRKWFLVLFLLAATAFLVWRREPPREFTTRSARAYALYQDARRESYALNYVVADSLLRQALALDPDFAAAHALRAALLRRTGRFEAAHAESLQAAALLDRLSPLERDRISLMLLTGARGRKAAVDSLVDRILAVRPDDRLALLVQAMELFGRHDPQAEPALRRLIALDPDNAFPYNLLGYLEAQRGDYRQAVDDLKTYAFLAPREPNPHDSLGEVLTWMGRYDEAEQELREALRLRPDFLPSLLNLGDLYLDRGEARRGERLLREVRRRALADASYPSLTAEVDRTILGQFYALELYQRAVAWTDTFLAGSDHPRDVYFRAVAAAVRGDSLSARSLLDGLLARLGDHGGRTATLMRVQLEAILAEIRGDVPAARAHWRRVLALLPHAPPHETWSIRWRLGVLTLAAGDPARAAALADTILAVNPHRLQALDLRARALLARADTAGARATLARLAPLAERADADLPLVRRYRRLRDALAPPAGGQGAP